MGKLVMESESGKAQPKVLLSMNQLVLRRGLTLLTTLLILIAGIAVHVACPLPKNVIPHQSNLTVDSNIFYTTNTFLNTTASSL